MNDTRFSNAESVLEELLGAAVLVEREGTLEPSARFLARRAEWLERFPDLDPTEVPVTVEGTVLERLDDDARRTVVSNALAVLDLVPTLAPSEALACGLSLRRFAEVRTDGVPDGFEALLGVEIEAFLDRYPTAIVFVWQPDSRPCEIVRKDLETMVQEGAIPRTVGKAAVEGTVDTELLATEYDVTAVPTLLFFVGGTVDSRMIGAHYPETIRSEIAMIVDSSER